MKEVWKDIKGYEGYYQVSNHGKVKSLQRVLDRSDNKKLPLQERPLKFGNSRGYPTVRLSKAGDNKTILLHHLIWDAFGNKPRNGRALQVDHIDENKLNNRIDNLQILTNRENCTKYHKSNKKSGLPTGVVYHRATKKYVAQIRIGDRYKYLGLFDDISSADKAYKKQLHHIT